MVSSVWSDQQSEKPAFRLIVSYGYNKHYSTLNKTIQWCLSKVFVIKLVGNLQNPIYGEGVAARTQPLVIRVMANNVPNQPEIGQLLY